MLASMFDIWVSVGRHIKQIHLGNRLRHDESKDGNAVASSKYFNWYLVSPKSRIIDYLVLPVSIRISPRQVRR